MLRRDTVAMSSLSQLWGMTALFWLAWLSAICLMGMLASSELPAYWPQSVTDLTWLGLSSPCILHPNRRLVMLGLVSIQSAPA